MKSANAVPAGVFDNFLTSLELNGQMLDELARNSGWSRAEPRKITLAQLLLALSFESIQGEASFNDISSRIHLLNGNGGTSRQAVSKRINAPFLGILESLLAKAIAAKADCESLACQDSALSRYDRVLIQDSTVIRLPAWLFARHTAAGADCIYRHKTGTTYLDEETGKPVDLLAELRRNGSLDRVVLLGDKERTRVRLVSAPVSREVADHRRMKAKKEMRGHNPSAETLALMDWTIFLTTADKKLDFTDILRIYGLRWRIEIIFKTWKSHLNFDAIHRVSDIGLRSILTMRLVMITEGTNVLYRTCHRHVKRHHDHELSLQKFLKRLGRSPELAARITRALADPYRQPGGPEREETRETWNHLVRYCCYDKRKRKNFFDQSNG